MPKLGTRKLYVLLKEKLKAEGLKLGRDKLFSILRDHDMLQEKKRRYVKTTNSKHWLRKYPNLVKDLVVSRAEQVWVSDITYIQTEQGFCYLTMLTDAYSRKIMGSYLSESLSYEGCLKALEEALRNRVSTNSLIHHSDRGLQYCSKEYTGLLEVNKIRISITEKSDPYENALAERMNRTIKEEFISNSNLLDLEIARMVTKESVSIYNNERPHMSCQMRTPEEVHKKSVNPIRATPSWG